MLFYSLFKTLINHEVTIECKNNMSIRGILVSVDQWLNMKLDRIRIVNDARSPDLYFIKNVFIRGNVVRYIYLAAQDVDTSLLHDATRTESSAFFSDTKSPEVLHAQSSSFVKSGSIKFDQHKRVY